MKSLHYCAVFFTCVILMACNSIDKRRSDDIDVLGKASNQTPGLSAAADSVDQLTILRNLLEPKGNPNEINDPSNEGHEVKLKDAIPCIEKFKLSMRVHAIIDTTKIMNMVIKRSRMITEYEEFGGVNLIGWMLKVVKKHDPKGNGINVAIRLKFGVYTEPFLKTYLPNKPALRAIRKERITIFLVPYYYGSHQGRDIDGSNPDDTAYEFGGLEP